MDILLLLSNQVVQICDNVFKLRSTSLNVDLVNIEEGAAVQFAWVTLQAHRMMQGHLQDKFKA
jgi:hypothetical protein